MTGGDRPVTEQLAAGKGPKEASERHSIDRWTRASGGWGSTSFSAVPYSCRADVVAVDYIYVGLVIIGPASAYRLLINKMQKG